METSLHRQLKQRYVTDGALVEQRVGRYRIDVVQPGRLVEIQLASLSAIRDKIAALLTEHRVLLVKPIVARKRLVKLRRKAGRVVSQRFSPKRGCLLDLFDELVHFTRVFPHPRLTLEVLMVEVEEWRYPGHGRRRWRRPGDYQIADQKLIEVVGTHRFESARDLCQLLPPRLPVPFHTGQIAERLATQRWVAQRMAYCMRQCGAIQTVGKQRGAWLYERVGARRAA